MEDAIASSIDRAISPKMTDLGFQLSSLVREQIHVDDEHMDDEDSGYLEKALSIGKKQKTGVRGRPKSIDFGFGRSSTTHKLAPEPARLMGLANVAYVSRDHARAIDLLLQAIRLVPSSFEPYHTLGLVYEEQGNYEKAGGCFMLAGLLNPSASDIWMKLADWAEQANSDSKRNEAIFCLSKAISSVDSDQHSEPWVEDLYWRRARLYISLDQATKAVRSFRILLRHFFEARSAEDCIDLVKRLAKLAMAQKIPLQAAQVVEKAMRMKRDGVSWSLVNLTLELMFVDAAVDYSRVLAVIDEHMPVLLDQTALLSQPEWGTWSDGERGARQLQMIPLEIFLKYCIASLHVHEDVSSISDRLQRLAVTDLSECEFVAMLADCLLERRQWQLALHLYSLMLSSESFWSAYACCKAGHCHRSLYQLTEAVSCYQTALSADPAMEEARIALAQLYRECGNTEGLVEMLESGRKIKQMHSKRKSRQSSSDDDWEESEASDSSGSDEIYTGGSFDLLHSSASRSKKTKQRLRQPPTRRHQYPSDQCARTRQEYSRLLMVFQVGPQRPQLFQEGLAATHELVTECFLKNPNIANKHIKLSDTATKDLFCGLTVEEWCDLCLRYACALCTGKQPDAGAKFLHSMLTETAILRWTDQEYVMRLWVCLAEVCKMAVACAVSPGAQNRFRQMLMSSLRPVLKLRSAHPETWAWIEGLVGSGSQGRLTLMSSSPFTRFLNRIVAKESDAVSKCNYLCLQAHLYGLSGSWEEALRTFSAMDTLLAGRDGDGELAKFSLFMGNAHLHRALQRTCHTQKWFFLKALAYLDLHLCPNTIVCSYNKGRLFHHLGVWEGAIRMYNVCLQPGTSDDVRRLAAYNMASIFAMKGKAALAEMILSDHCRY